MRAYSFVLFMSQTPARALATLPVRMELQMHGRLFLWLKTLECYRKPNLFCIDTDVTKSQMTTYIVPYVQGILSELEGSGYKLGIYGPKPVCKYIRGTYSATERYMMICDNDWGSRVGWPPNGTLMIGIFGNMSGISLFLVFLL